MAPSSTDLAPEDSSPSTSGSLNLTVNVCISSVPMSPSPSDLAPEDSSPSTSGPQTGPEESMWQLSLRGTESYPERHGLPDCVYYMRTGFCGYGNRCHYNHPRDRAWDIEYVKLYFCEFCLNFMEHKEQLQRHMDDFAQPHEYSVNGEKIKSRKEGNRTKSRQGLTVSEDQMDIRHGNYGRKSNNAGNVYPTSNKTKEEPDSFGVDGERKLV